jgi:putative endonuclease
MKKKKKDILGQEGEAFACEYLQSIGYKILQRNWQHHPYEIDIIAGDRDDIVVVEVKTRSGSEFGEPQDFVSRRKQSLLVKAAQLYAETYNIQQEIRFDVVAVIMNKFEKKLHHIPNAFIPLLGM